MKGMIREQPGRIALMIGAVTLVCFAVGIRLAHQVVPKSVGQSALEARVTRIINRHYDEMGPATSEYGRFVNDLLTWSPEKRRGGLNEEQPRQLLAGLNDPNIKASRADAYMILTSCINTNRIPKSLHEAVFQKAVEGLKATDSYPPAQALLRSGAIGLLGNTGDQRAVPYILPFLNDPDGLIRIAAKRGLKQLGYNVESK